MTTTWRGHRPGPPLHGHRRAGGGACAVDGGDLRELGGRSGPDTGAPRWRVRTDERAVRFVEVVVDGPKSWSLAVAVHPDVAAAYDAAQDRAAVEIIGWLVGHATTRIGPRGRQVQVPLEVLEAVTVRHWRHLGTGPRSFRLGRRVLYRRDDLRAWIDAQRGGDGASSD
jgi:hypothetical protein